MPRRSNFSKPATIDVQGVLGTFKVPDANLTVEYILTYTPLDGGQTANGQLLDLLVPVREVFDLEALDFDHLLQRDLDDFRVSEEMVPYLLGKTSSDPRFFPPIVAVIVPMTGTNMKELYPQRLEDTETDGNLTLKVFKYGDVFSVKQEEQNGQLAQSPVDLCIHPTNANLVIVDGQHRAMAMLATYRSALNKWSGSEFQHFYQIDDKIELSDLRQIHLPVCIAYFPELTEEKQTTAERNLTTACRKIFLDVNRNARHPSQARQILLDDTDLVACFTRHLFNMVKNNDKTSNAKTNRLQLHHTEYDNPQDRVPIFRPFALTDVYTLFSVVRSVLLMDDNRVRKPIASSDGIRPPQNNSRLQRELDLKNVLTEENKDELGIEDIADIKSDTYPRRAEERLRQCFEDGWGQVIIKSLNQLYPFLIHIKAVETVLKDHEPYTGVNQIARTALVEGQGLRHTLDQQQQRDKESRREKGFKHDDEESDAEEAWRALQKIEEDFRKYRAKSYLKLSRAPDDEEIKMVNHLFDCFRSNAFQIGLFMAFACLKDRIAIDDKQEFVKSVDRWIKRINKKFDTSSGASTILFNHSNQHSLRYIYKPRRGLKPADWHFFRYLILELLTVKTGKEAKIIEEAQKGWRSKLYEILYNRKKNELGSEENEESDSQDRLNLQPFSDMVDELTFHEIVEAFKNSLDIDEERITTALQEIKKRSSQSVSDIEDEDETENLSEEQ